MIKYIIIAVALFIALVPTLFRMLLETSLAPKDTEIGSLQPWPSDAELSSKLKGKNVLLVGGTRGIGLGIALVLARVGANVTLVGRSESSAKVALEQVQQMAKSSSQFISTKFIQGDFSTVKSSLKTVAKIKSENIKYDHMAVSIGVFPDWNDPLTPDGIEKSVAIANLGRYILFKHCLEFLHPSARILNILLSGTQPEPEIDRKFIEGIYLKKELPHSLYQALHDIPVLNDLMNVEFAEKWKDNDITLIGTAPGWITTELHTGQGYFFDKIVFPLLDTFASYPLLDIGTDYVTALVSTKITKKLSFFDSHMHARIVSSEVNKIHKENRDWYIQLVESVITSKS